MIEEMGWQGTWNIKVVDKITRNILREENIKNRVMNTALDELIKVLNGETTDLEISYMALGTGSTAVTNTDTKLATEIFRTPLTEKTVSGTGQLTTTFIVLDVEAVSQIEEIGIFGGSTATGTVDAGTLISRILWSHTKTNSEEIQFTRIDKIVRG